MTELTYDGSDGCPPYVTTFGLLDRLGEDRAVVGGAGLGTTITLRTARTCPESTPPC